MNKTTFTLLACAAALAGAFFLGRLSVTETVTTAPAAVAIEPVKDHIIPAKVDTVELARLKKENRKLYDQLTRLLTPKWETGYPGDTGSPYRRIVLDSEKVVTYLMDDSTEVAVNVGLVHEGDTVHSSAKTKMRVSAMFYGEPFNTFQLIYAGVDPFVIPSEVTTRSRDNGVFDLGGFAFRFTGGYQQIAGLGGELQLGKISAGAMFLAGEKPLWTAGYRLFDLDPTQLSLWAGWKEEAALGARVNLDRIGAGVLLFVNQTPYYQISYEIFRL